jgi:soluble lytic murein transglycosylase-like protein
MTTSLTHSRKPVRLPKLAALTLVFLGFSTNAQLDAATPWSMPTSLPTPHAAPSVAPVLASQEDPALHILSPKDATLYRAAFAAQESGDTKTADTALAEVKDRRLVGHVLADRYLGHSMDLAQARQWMDAYADLPEADDLYDQARSLKGFTAAHIKAPISAASWTGTNGSNLSSGFHGDNDSIGGKNRVDNSINASLRHGDPMEAREMMATEVQRGTLSVGEANEMTSRIAAAFFYEGETERARSLAHSAAASGIPLALWIDGLAAWKQQDYLMAGRSFSSLAQAPGLSAWDRAAASYWAYRAAKRTGDDTQAHHWLAEAAKYPRCFYGYMAVSQLGHSPARSWKMPELTARNIDMLAQHPAGAQALALVQVGKPDLAESELRQLNPVGQRDLETALLALAEKAHMPSLTMQLGGAITNGNGQVYEAALYPVPPWQPSDGFKVDRALLFALMKHESQFDPQAVSDRGACGLMQIMPSTARAIGNNDKPGRNCSDHLLDPATNMEMGQKYVRVLAGQPVIGDNLLLLLAAYNGGPGNVARWMDGNTHTDPLLFVESMPIRQTRDYVQQVLLHYWIYRDRLNEPTTSVAQLARGEWPRYALRDDSVKKAQAQDLEVASVK